MTFLVTQALIQLYSRFADRDVFMRYEWGLAVGHEYAHRDATKANQAVLARPGHIEPGDPLLRAPTTVTSPPHSAHPNRERTEVIDPGSDDLEPGIGAPRVIRDTCMDKGEGELGGGDWESDTESQDGDDEDFFSDPGRDSEEEREAALFGDQ